jgi:AcrR family transcriptional regulator
MSPPLLVRPYHKSAGEDREVPKRVDHDERRAQIADALLGIASDRGLAAVTFREVAAEAGVSVRLVQYYFQTKEQLLIWSMGHLARRLDAGIRRRAAELPTPLTRRQVVYVVLTSVLPLDDERRAQALAFTACYAVALTDPALASAGVTWPDALIRYLTGVLMDARVSGELVDGADPAVEAPLLLALTNGLTSAVLGGMHSPEIALDLLTAHLDKILRR